MSCDNMLSSIQKGVPTSTRVIKKGMMENEMFVCQRSYFGYFGSGIFRESRQNF